MKCKICGKDVHGSGMRYCSNECRIEGEKQIKEEKLKKNREKAEKKYNGLNEGSDYIVCKWCGTKTSRVYGAHIKNFHPGKTSEDYKNEFPDAPLCCSKDATATSKNSGKHMREEKYRKMCSEKWSGDKNPNSKANKTEQERKESSPWSKEFYIKRGATIEEAEQMVHDFAKEALRERIAPTQLQYYLNKGMSEADAKEALKERQTTFNLEKCIEKYGEEEGRKRWEERQEKWSAKLEEKYKNCEFNRNPSMFSKAEKEIATIISEKFENVSSFLSSQFCLKDEKKRFYYDIKYKNKIIEFNGVYWHCKPELFEADYFHPILKMTAKDKWEYDKRKIECAQEAGYQVLTIWEDEYEYDPDATIKKCIDFLNV